MNNIYGLVDNIVAEYLERRRLHSELIYLLSKRAAKERVIHCGDTITVHLSVSAGS